MSLNSTVSLRMVLLIALIIVAIQGVTLAYFGQSSVCPCGVLKVWEPTLMGVGNNQQMFNWYTFSHIIHRECA